MLPQAKRYTLQLTREQAEKLESSLRDYTDEGREGEGSVSEELKDLQKAVYVQLAEQGLDA